MSSKLLKKLFKSTFSTTVNEEKMEKNENNLLETHKMNGKTLNAKKNSTACQKKHLGSEKQGQGKTLRKNVSLYPNQFFL